ncbi:Uncharacterised protein [Paenibacillus macerans]|nr:hypothetical protein DJ90_1467 [Paenibacillus macerans]SUD25516.1 Uncharacterised protein [Paenibacillus macerans]
MTVLSLHLLKNCLIYIKSSVLTRGSTSEADTFSSQLY